MINSQFSIFNKFSIFNFQTSKLLYYLLFSFFTFYFLLLRYPLLADAANFTTNYNVTYDIFLDGKAKVTQEITLTNNTANLYPADYTLTVKGGEIEKVTARDELGEMKVEVSKTESESAIRVSFNKQAIGQGSKVSWTLSYEVPEFAVKRGRIWELTVPRVAETSDIGDYNVTLKVPKEFGPEHYISPQPDLTKHSDSFWAYKFNQLPITNYQLPIAMAFGDFQLFSFRLLYHLQNPENFTATTEIALPPDLPAQAGIYPYQRIYYQNLSPKPQQIKKDADGNFLAEYKLAAKEKLDIVFEGTARVTSNINQPPTTNHQPPTSLQPYLLPAKYWEVNAEEIRNLLEEIKKMDSAYTLNPNPYTLSRAIYNYVTTNLSYDPTRINKQVERLGAVAALQHKDSAVCMEFTDLLITLMRAAGIPARELNGYAYTSEDENKPTASDTLHSWVQVWLPYQGEITDSSGLTGSSGSWLNIDPTWGATTGIDYFTKLDTNHLAFVIKGIDSEKPYPAGSYKIKESQEGDVQVSFAEKFAGNVIPFRLWWETWEQENKKLDWLTALFNFLARFF